MIDEMTTTAAQSLHDLPVQELVARCEAAYIRAKPIHDSMVDLSLEIAALTTEIYRRKLEKLFPAIPIDSEKLLLSLSVTVSPNEGLPKLSSAVQSLRDAGVVVSRIAYDHTKKQFNLYSAA